MSRDYAYINDYGFRPYSYHYRGKGPMFLGVELELDGYDSDLDYFTGMMSSIEQDGFIYLKEDDSLDDGVEVVTHPASIDYHMETPFWGDILRAAQDSDFVSGINTAGLHVHVSKAAISKRVENRLLVYYWRHWDQIVKISGRGRRQIEDWAYPNHTQRRWSRGTYNAVAISDKPRTNDYAAAKGGRGAINFHPSTGTTIEFRIFQSTLRYLELMARIEFVAATVEVCKQLSIPDITVGKAWPKLYDHAKNKYPHLHEYLMVNKI